MSLRVAFDMDGTVADMYTALRHEAERLFGLASPEPAHSPAAAAEPAESGALPESPLPAAVSQLRLTAPQKKQLWDRVRQIENFWTTLPEQEPGIIARIAATAHARRWEVLFITTRPASAGDITQVQTQRWLESRGFPCPSVFVVHRSRGKLADALQLDAVVDDRPDNCMDVAIDSKARPVLVWPGAPKSVPAGMKRLGVRPVASIADAVTLLERMDDARKQSRVVRSLRRMLGRDAD